jgi:hypothetical protein
MPSGLISERTEVGAWVVVSLKEVPGMRVGRPALVWGGGGCDAGADRVATFLAAEEGPVRLRPLLTR